MCLVWCGAQSVEEGEGSGGGIRVSRGLLSKSEAWSVGEGDAAKGPHQLQKMPVGDMVVALGTQHGVWQPRSSQ